MKKITIIGFGRFGQTLYKLLKPDFEITIYSRSNILDKSVNTTNDLKIAYQGEVIFFDAFPLSAPTIEVDVMTPHYGEYYSKKDQAPVDTLLPNPIPFLTVVNTDFQFLMGSKKFSIQDKLWKYEGKELTLSEWLQKALTEHGIGAKTAVGYGYMK